MPIDERGCDSVTRMSTKSTNWALEKWGDYLTAAGRPATTRTLRLYHLSRLAADYPAGPASVDVDELVTWLASHDWAPNTRRSYRASLRAYWAWANATGRQNTSPAALLPVVTIPRSQPRPTPEIAYRTALIRADERARLAIRLAGQCGLRRGEIARLRGEDLEQDLLGWSLRIAGKGGHVRMVPVEDDLASRIRERGPGWIFPSSHGGHLTPHHLGRIVSAHLPGNLTTHTLRHRCGTVAYAATKDLLAVQELLGHAKPETTRLYTAIPRDDVRAAMRAAAA